MSCRALDADRAQGADDLAPVWCSVLRGRPSRRAAERSKPRSKLPTSWPPIRPGPRNCCRCSSWLPCVSVRGPLSSRAGAGGHHVRGRDSAGAWRPGPATIARTSLGGGAMNLSMAYYGRSRVAPRAGSRRDLELPPPEPCRAIRCLRRRVAEAPAIPRGRFPRPHDVVISDLRLKPRDKTAYQDWKKQQQAKLATLRREGYKRAKEGHPQNA